jgi:hypothetical protein
MLPNTSKWYNTHVPISHLNDQRNETYNISEIVLAAMGSVMEANQIMHGPSIRESQLETYALVINNCKIQRERVSYICTRLREGLLYVRLDSSKFHQCDHFPPQSQESGILLSGSDTSQGESGHKKSKNSFDGTSKRGGVNFAELALHEEKVLLSQYLFGRIQKKDEDEKLRQQYELTNQLGLQEIRFVNGHWKGKQLSLCMHPFLNEQSFSDVLNAYINSSDDFVVSLVNGALNQDKNITTQLLHGIKANGNLNLHIHKYHIRATSVYPYQSGDKSRLCEAYSFIEIKFDSANSNENNSVARVMTIVQFSSKSEEAVLIIIAKLELVKKENQNKYYPYRQYQYMLNKTGKIEFQVITTNNIVGPLFVISTVSTSCFIKESVQKGFRKQTFYVVGSTRIRNKDSIIKYSYLNSNFPNTFLSVAQMNSFDMSLRSDPKPVKIKLIKNTKAKKAESSEEENIMEDDGEERVEEEDD